MRDARCWLLACGVLGCTDLPDLQADGTCGNGVLEPAAGEDCDRSAGFENGACGSPDTPAACRLVCGGANCPEGWSCGEDRICRAPAGRWSLADPVPFAVSRADQVKVADLDGDGREDLVGPLGGSLQRLYGAVGPGWSTPAPFSVGEPAGEIAVGDLDGDGADDVAVPLFPWPVVVKGRSDQTFEPVNYVLAEQDVRPGSTYRVFSVQLGGRLVTVPTIELMTLETTDQGVAIRFPLAAFDLTPSRANQSMALGYVGEPAPDRVGVGNLDGGPDDEVALGLVGWDRVEILSPSCLANLACGYEVVERSRIRLAQGRVGAGGVELADVDGDGDVDALIYAEDALGVPFLAVSFGRGNGTFCANPSILCGGEALQRADRVRLLGLPPGTGWPLATGDFNGDGLIDFVFASGVYQTTPGLLGVERTASPGLGKTWGLARVGDFNRDGIPDVVAGFASGEPVLQVLLGTGLFFGRRIVQLEGPPTLVEVGDFDGDLFEDLAVADGTDEVQVLYGGLEGLGARASAGIFADLEAATPVDFLVNELFDEPDAVRDLVVVQNDGTIRRLSALLGNPSRRLQAALPFIVGSTIALGGNAITTAPSTLVLDDLGLDDRGGPDLMAGGPLQAPSVWFAEGDGAGGFEELQLASTFTGCGLRSLWCGRTAVRDSDGDGRSEILIAESSDVSASCTALGAVVRAPSPVVLDLWSGDRLEPTCTQLEPFEIEGLGQVRTVQQLDLGAFGDADRVDALVLLRRTSRFGSSTEPPQLLHYVGPLQDGGAATRVATDVGAPLAFTAWPGAEGPLALLTDEGVYVGGIEPGGVFRVAVEVVAFSELVQTDVVGRMLGPGPVPQAPLALHALEVNGDGFVDVVILNGDEVFPFLAETCGSADAAAGRCRRTEPSR